MAVNSSTVTGGQTVTAVERNNLRKDVLIHAGDTLTDSGSANAYDVTADSQITALGAGLVVKFIPSNENTGASTLRYRGGSGLDQTDNIVLADGTSVRYGDIRGMAYCMFDGTDWILLNPGGNILSGNIIVVTAGETIAANEIVYYSQTDGEWLKADANDPDKVRARAIALTAGTNGNPMTVQLDGVYVAPSGTPFTADSQHYLSDTAGGISTTPSTTTSVPIGFGLSTTELLLTWGRKMASGTATSQSETTTTNNDETIDLGFRPEEIILHGRTRADNDYSWGHIHYCNGVIRGGSVYQTNGTSTFGSSGTPRDPVTDGGIYTAYLGTTCRLSVNAVSDTSFTIRTAHSPAIAQTTESENINWIALGN